MESFLENLKKDVQCSLCNDTLIEPKILPCFHTFCKLCIKRHAELIEQVNVFKCPKCSSQTLLPDHEECCLDNLKPNNLYTRISDVLNFASKEKVCSVCESHPIASWYCCECDRLMCDKCVKNHVVFIDAHKVINLNELNVEDLQLKLKREDNCTSHVGQRFEVFCQDCDALVCLLCLKQAHTEHKLLSLDAFASLKREKMSRHLQELEQLAFNEQEIQEQKYIASLIKQNGEKAIKEVKDRTKQLIEILQKNEQELLQQIKNKMERANRNLNIIHHFPAVKEHINNVMQRATASEMINIRETECSEDFIFNPIQEISEVVFVPNEELMQQAVIGLGDIQTKINSKTDNTMSTIQVESEPEVLRQEKLVLITKMSTGEVSNNEGDVVEVKFSPEDDVKDVKYTRTDSKIEVEFMAKVVGPLTAEVQVNGNHVSNSPLVMNVKPQQMGITGEFKMKDVSSGSHTLTGIAVNKDNSKVAVAYESCSCIHVFNTNGDHLLKFGRKGSGERQLIQPEGLVFLNETDLVIADNRNYRICIMNTATGKLIKTFGKLGRSDGDFNDSYGVDVDIDSNIIACDYHNNRVQVFTRDGDYQYQFGLTKQDNFGPVSAVTHGERFYVSDHNNHVIHVFEKKDGVPTKISTIASKGSGDGQLNTPWGLAIDNDHNLLVCDRGNNRIQKFTLDGHFVGKTHDKLKDPRYVTVLNDGQILVTTFRSGLFIVNRVSKTEDVGQGLRSGRTRRR